MRIRLSALFALVPLVVATACGSTYGGAVEPDAGVDPSNPTPNGSSEAGPGGGEGGAKVLPECKTQRVVELVGGNGGLAHFTLLWPLPTIVDMPSASYAIDDVSNFTKVTTDPSHELYARTANGVTLFQGTGKNPLVSAFVANLNQLSTHSPMVTRLTNGIDVVGVAALAQQTALAPNVPVVNVGAVDYGAVPTGPTALAATSVADAVDQVAAHAGVDPSLLAPDETKVATWTGPDARTTETAVAEGLLFAVNAFHQNLAGTILLPAFLDRPEGEFADGDATTDGVTLEGVLDAFYDELAKYAEPSCGHNGAPLSLVDNVVLIVSGDTPLDPFARSPWTAGTPSGGNFLYVRSNGFVKPGWFGTMTPDASVQFDPMTGVLDFGATTDGPSTDAALGGLLYAIVRGDVAGVAKSGVGAYAGVITSSAP